MTLALQKLYDLSFRKLGLSGGGSINGAFLRQGLIDEISIGFSPLAIGGRKTPSIFDCDELLTIEDAAPLDLINTQPVGNGAVWVYYRVKK